VKSYELFRKAKNSQVIEDASTAQKTLAFLDSLEDQDDVQKVYANIDIPQEILQNLNS
jgi:transcriptional/translational regulatory protein YebC/TACO1